MILNEISRPIVFSWGGNLVIFYSILGMTNVTATPASQSMAMSVPHRNVLICFLYGFYNGVIISDSLQLCCANDAKLLNKMSIIVHEIFDSIN